MRRAVWLLVAALVTAATACEGDRGGDLEDLHGERVEILAVWEDVEAARFRRVLRRFEQQTGASVQYTSTDGDDASAVLDRRLGSGRPPDLAVLPQPGVVARFARSGDLQPVEALVGDTVDRGWSSEWRRLGTVDGELYGVWFKAAHKSLVWYDIATFERVGVVPPSDPQGFAALAETMVAAGVPAFAVSPADEWTLTDWFENLYLRIAGPGRYDALARGDLPWTDATVVETLGLLGRLLTPPMATGGPDATFPESVRMVFGSSPTAAMIAEGDFVAGEITGSTEARLGVDADVFPFPDPNPARRLVVGGGDAVVLLRRSPASTALLRYLAGTEAAEVWAALGGFVSPNAEVDLAVYPDAITRGIARSLIEAGEGFRFDLSDLQPAAFGATSGSGMLGILRAFVTDPADAAGTARRLEEAASAARADIITERARPVARASLVLPLRDPARPRRPASSAAGAPLW
jgi:alpha-glucoside transport system substrate-binding protein